MADFSKKEVRLPTLEELENLAANIEKNLPVLYRLGVLQAQVKRFAYEAYIEQGFTEEQALELCKTGV